MTHSQKRILAFLLKCPGATVAEIADQLGINPPGASAQVKTLRESGFIETAHPKQKKRARYFIQKELLDSLSPDSAAERLGSHCARRYERTFFQGFHDNVSREHNPIGTGIFDVQSIIHAAVTTDPQLTIVSWSPRFEKLVEDTTPLLLKTLRNRRLKYIASPTEKSWFGALQKVMPFDWEIGDVNHGADARFDEDGLWEQILEKGIVDALAFQTQTIDAQPVYLEFYIAPQFTFLGYQSIMMNVRNRVLSVKAENTNRAHFEFLHHDLSQPLLQIRALETLMYDALEGRSEEDPREIFAGFSKAADRFEIALGMFPAASSSTLLDVPVLRLVLTAIDRLKYEDRPDGETGQCQGPIRILNESIHADETRYLTAAIPCLLYGAMFEFLRNTQTHGRSASGTSVSYCEVDEGHATHLHIVIADKGCGLSDVVLAEWNEESDNARGADVTDIGKKGGRMLAIMGVKTAGGKVRFSATSDSDTNRGLTITIRLPVTEAKLLPVEEAQ